MTFASDAHRKWWFANNGGAGSGGGVPSFSGPVAAPSNGHFHTITVCGVEKHIWVDNEDVDSPEESKAIADKEDRKALDMQQMTGGGWK